MAEQFDLTAPIVPASLAHYRVSFLTLDWDGAAIRGAITETTTGAQTPFSYNGAAALALMTTLNTANLSVSSLVKRTLLKLQTDGILPAGSVTGTPS